MPIRLKGNISAIPQDQFHAIDEEVMELVFAMHKDLGRFHDERVYQKELAHECGKRFDNVATEVPIAVSYKDFSRVYAMDLLIDGSVMVELKAVEAINPQHRKQALNYLLLSGLHHGKLINMRPASVQYEFVSTRLTPARRFEYRIHDSQWDAEDDDSVRLKDLMLGMLAEWGAFLDADLFRDAICHFLGGEHNVIRKIQVQSGSRVLGSENALCLNAHTGFRISAATRNVAYYERDLRRLVRHTALGAIQWVNLNHHTIEFRTVRP